MKALREKILSDLQRRKHLAQLDALENLRLMRRRQARGADPRTGLSPEHTRAAHAERWLPAFGPRDTREMLASFEYRGSSANGLNCFGEPLLREGSEAELREAQNLARFTAITGRTIIDHALLSDSDRLRLEEAGRFWNYFSRGVACFMLLVSLALLIKYFH